MILAHPKTVSGKRVHTGCILLQFVSTVADTTILGRDFALFWSCVSLPCRLPQCSSTEGGDVAVDSVITRGEKRIPLWEQEILLLHGVVPGFRWRALPLVEDTDILLSLRSHRLAKDEDISVRALLWLRVSDCSWRTEIPVITLLLLVWKVYLHDWIHSIHTWQSVSDSAANSIALRPSRLYEMEKQFYSDRNINDDIRFQPFEGHK